LQRRIYRFRNNSIAKLISSYTSLGKASNVELIRRHRHRRRRRESL